jgi:hypothetical protein
LLLENKGHASNFLNFFVCKVYLFVMKRIIITFMTQFPIYRKSPVAAIGWLNLPRRSRAFIVWITTGTGG